MERVANGTFNVTIAPLPFEGQPDGSALARMSIDKTIAGDLVATTRGQMLSAMICTKGSAGYVAIERVEGVLDGRRGAFVLQHTGVMHRGEPSLEVSEVPDSGTDALEGSVRRQGTIAHAARSGVQGQGSIYPRAVVSSQFKFHPLAFRSCST